MPGTALALGPFTIDHRIGRGGMGEVWRGRHREQGVPVAIKVVHARLWSRPEARVAFHDEVRAVAGLDHPGVVAVYDHGEVPEPVARGSGEAFAAGSPYLVMELADGGSLDAVPGPRCWTEAREVLRALLDALAHAHARGVVHRDLKPGNVLVSRGGGVPTWKLTDFGIARALDRQGDHRVITGTPAYMAPEQLLGRWRDTGPATDLYALGCMAWELCAGHPPFAGASSLPAAHLHQPPPPFVPRFAVPEGVEAWLATLLAKEPPRRYACAADAAWVLGTLGEPVGEDPGLPLVVAPARSSATLTLASLDSPSDAITAHLPVMSGRFDESTGLPPAVRPPIPSLGRRPAPPPPPPLYHAGLSLYALRTLPILGREGEQDALWGLLRGVAEGQGPRAVVLEGEPGVGKTRLAAWLAERAVEVGAASVLRVTHAPVPGPGDGLAAMVERALAAAGLDRDGVEGRIQRQLSAGPPDEPVDAVALADLLRPRLGGIEQGGSSRAERLQVLRRWIERQAASRPVVLWIEDAHHATDALDLALALLSRSRPVLVLVTARSGAGAPQPDRLLRLRAHAQARSLPVGPLPEAELLRLVSGPLHMDPSLADRISRKAAGVPMYAVQLVREWIQDGQLVPGPDGFRLREGAVVELPADLHAVWSAYLDQLVSGPARVAVEVAAALGLEVDTREWSLASATTGADLAGVREALVRRGLAVPEPSGWRFAHALFRESVLRGAREAGHLAARHAACAAALEHTGPRAEGRRGVHLDEAGEPDAALPLLLRGARLALREDDHPSAAELLDRAAHALGALSAGEDDPRRGELDLIRAKLLQREPPLDRAQALAMDAEARALRHGWTQVAAEAAFRVGEISRLRGDLPVADAAVDRALARAEALGDRELHAQALRGRAHVAVMTGNLPLARAAVHAALEANAQVANRFGVATAWMLAGEIGRTMGQWEEAETALRRALELYLEVRSRTGVAVCRLALAEITRLRGDAEGAEVLYRELVSVNEALGRDNTIVSLNLALCLVSRGEYDEAHTLLVECCASWERKARPGYLACALVALLVPLAWKRHWTEWDEVCARAEGLLQRTGMVDRDIADQAGRAAGLAAEAGEGARAGRVTAIARAQWGRLGG